jgi:hypothetical protein
MSDDYAKRVADKYIARDGSDPNIIQFKTAGDVELAALKREVKEAKEQEKEKRRDREMFLEEWMRKHGFDREATKRVVEWCFVNFRFHPPLPEWRKQRLTKQQMLMKVCADICGEIKYDPDEHPYKTFLRCIIAKGVEREGGEYADIAYYLNQTETQKLRSIHREISKHTPSPFSKAELIRAGIEEEPRKPKARLFDHLLKPQWSTPTLEEIAYTPELRALQSGSGLRRI